MPWGWQSPAGPQDSQTTSQESRSARCSGSFPGSRGPGARHRQTRRSRRRWVCAGQRVGGSVRVPVGGFSCRRPAFRRLSVSLAVGSDSGPLWAGRARTCLSAPGWLLLESSGDGRVPRGASWNWRANARSGSGGAQVPRDTEGRPVGVALPGEGRERPFLPWGEQAKAGGEKAVSAGGRWRRLGAGSRRLGAVGRREGSRAAGGRRTRTRTDRGSPGLRRSRGRAVAPPASQSPQGRAGGLWGLWGAGAARSKGQGSGCLCARRHAGRPAGWLAGCLPACLPAAGSGQAVGCAGVAWGGGEGEEVLGPAGSRLGDRGGG